MPPNRNRNAFIAYITDNAQIAMSMGLPVYIMGDFNILCRLRLTASQLTFLYQFPKLWNALPTSIKCKKNFAVL